MSQPARKALILGLRLGNSASLACQLSALGLKVWVASADLAELSSLRLDENIFVHRLFANRIASIHEVFEAIDAHPGTLDFVLFEAAYAGTGEPAEHRVPDSIKATIITVISQALQRMAPLARGWIYVHDEPSDRRNSWLPALFSKHQTLEKLVEGAAAEAKASGIKVEFLAAPDSLAEIEYVASLLETRRLEDQKNKSFGIEISQSLS